MLFTGRITYWRCKLSVTNKTDRKKENLWEVSYRLESGDPDGIWKIKCGPEDKVALGEWFLERLSTAWTKSDG